MLKFLAKNFRSWLEIIGKGDEDRYISDPTGDLSYAHGKYQIGFDYGAGWGTFDNSEREFYFAALRWIAIQVGQRRKALHMDSHEKTYNFATPVPFIIYDGCDNWPVLLERPAKSKLSLSWCWTDQLGLVRDKDDIAERYRLLIWEHLITPVLTKKGRPTEVNVRPEVFEVLGCKPEDGLPALNLEMQVKLVRRLLWKEVLAARVPIRTELKRLDHLWQTA